MKRFLMIAAMSASIAHGAPFTAFSSGKGDVTISHDGDDYLKFGLVAWGPNWGWAGVAGVTKSDNGVATGTLTAKVQGGPLLLAMRAARTAPSKLELDYELRAEKDAQLTLFIVELAPGNAFKGRTVGVLTSGQQKVVACPFARGTIGERVEALKFTDAGGQTTTVRFEPACLIEADGAARMVLAKDRFAASETRKLKVNVELPGAADWFASPAEVPDEPGIASWYPWHSTGDSDGGVIGMQDWLEKPAGKHGRIVRKDDKLIYNGQPIKLWGINLCYATCAPEKALADKRAAFYPKYGINTVRLHKFADGAGWAGILTKESAAEYDAAGLDRMDYQVAKFKEAGIYVDLSAHFGTLKLGPADRKLVPFMDEFGKSKSGRVETPASAIHYSPELQQVHIQQIVNLLKHKNPYTGLTYAEDPAIAFIEIINEQSILFYTSMGPLKASATLRQQVGARFCDWLRHKYGTHDKLAAAWGPAAFDCFAAEGFKTTGEHLDKNNILPLGNPWFWDPEQLNGSQASRRQRLLDSMEFLYTLQCEFYDRYVKAVRTAGYKGELIGSNWQAGRAFSHFANLHADATVGTVDRHNYFGGKHANATMLARAGSGMLSSGMQQVADRPFMLSEWIHESPNEYGLEGPALLGAYGLGLQGWDVSYMFQNGDNAEFSAKIGRERWDVVAPQILGLFPAVARQVLRGDVKESNIVAPRNVDVPSLFAGKLGFDDKVAQGYDDKELDSSKVSARALAVARSVIAFTNNPTAVFDLKPYEKNNALVSTTGQLSWKEGREAFFTMDTDATKAVVGFANGQTCALGGVTIKPESRFAAIYVTAPGRTETIANAKSLLVVALARARNTGMKFAPAGDKLLAPGVAPVLMEPVKAVITIPGKSRVVLLDHDGKRTGKTLPVTNGTFTIDGAGDKTPYYLAE